MNVEDVKQDSSETSTCTKRSYKERLLLLCISIAKLYCGIPKRLKVWAGPRLGRSRAYNLITRSLYNDRVMALGNFQKSSSMNNR